MLRTITIAILLFVSSSAVAATKTAAATGNWSSASTWSPSGVPASGDDVVIEDGYTVTLDGSYTCASLTINNEAAVAGANDSKLTITNGYTLTVTGNASLNTTVSGLSTGSTSIQVNGVLSISGNLSLNNTLITVAGTNAITIGSASNAGELNVTGNVDMSNGLLTALGISNQITLGYGTLNIDGDITASAGALSLLSTNNISVNDNGSYNGRAKYFKYGGNNINLNDEGSITISDSNSNTDYEFWYDGTSAQTVEVDNITYNHLYIKNTAADVDLESSLTNALVEGKLYIDAGAKLHLDVAAKNLDNLSGSTDKINILADGTLKLSPNAYPDGIPPSTVITSNAAGIVEFYHPTGGSSADVFQESIDYPIVKLSGAGTKALGASSLDIDNSAPRVGRIWLAEGVFQVDSGKEITLNSSYGSKTIQLDSNTTMRIDGDFSTLDTYWDVHRDNTINYYGNSAQTIYELTSDGSTWEAYGILRLERTSGSGVDRTLPASDTIHVAHRVELEAEIDLILGASSYLKLLSNIQYTAYIAEIASSATIAYNGSPAGMIGAQKYLPLPYRAYRDVSSPIQGTTLQSWKDAGFNMRGFTGSSSPGAGRVTVTYYDETTLDELNIGFQDATNITNTTHSYDGSDFEISAWRLLDGNNSDTTYAITLEDKGEIFTGDQTYKLKFTYSNYDGNSRTDHDGWNFLGNPYAAPINWNAIYNDPANATLKSNGYITSSCYIIGQVDRYWADPGSPGYYGFYNAATETSYIHDSIIPAYQGFWVKAYHASSSSEEYTLTIKESHKYNYEDSKYYKSGSQKKAKSIKDVAMSLTLKNGNKKDVVWVQPFEGASTGTDREYDVAKFGSFKSASFGIDFKQDTSWLNLWVNAISLTKTIELPLVIKSNRAGINYLRFDHIQRIAGNHCAVLKNDATGEVVYLSDGMEIPVELTNGISEIYRIIISNAYDSKFTVEHPKCYGDSGKITMEIPSAFQSKAWSYQHNGGQAQDLDVSEGSMSFAAASGVLRIENTTGKTACWTNHKEIIVKHGALVDADFFWSGGDSIASGSELEFVASQGNLDQSIWSVDGTPMGTGGNFWHQFMEAGTYAITHAARKVLCERSETATIVVQQTVGINSTFISEDKGYWIEKGYLYFSDSPEQIRILDASGKTIAIFDEPTKKIPLQHGLYLYCFDKTCLKIKLSSKP